MKKCIYIINAYRTNFVKIGYTNNLTRRIKEIQIGCPYKLNLIFFLQTKDYKLIEKSLHNKFKQDKIRGEWFNINIKEIDRIFFQSK